ncbi:MAG TPA: hypothetical protein VGE08_24965 [Steroidobacter sp.]|uniref:hypothetical protein n=1 Tax=Steroidobacter sp. TaxID=1978227 RepID=UPI002ED88E39
MSRPDLWIEAHRYGTRVLAHDLEPWLKPAELGLFYRQLADLLRPELIELPILPPMRAYLATTSTDAGDPQKVVTSIIDALSEDTFRQTLTEGFSAVCGAGLRSPLAIALPGPDALLAGVAPHLIASVEDDERDALAIVLTDLVRMLARFSLQRLVLHESSPAALDASDVLLNLTRDYRIPVTLIADLPAANAPSVIESTMPASTAAVAWQAGRACRVLSEQLWASPEEIDPACWRDAQVVRLLIPPNVAPEVVMRVLAHLRCTP